MWTRCIVIAALSCSACGGSPPAPSEPEPAPAEPPAAAVEAPATSEVEAPADPPTEPPADPVEAPQPAAPKPKPEPETTCADFDKGRCQVTEGCEWHSVKKCLDQEKPKTLE